MTEQEPCQQKSELGSDKSVVGHFNRQPRIVILSTFVESTLSEANVLSVNSTKDLGPHSLYSEILRLRLRMTRW
jgi:hypothetical protein